MKRTVFYSWQSDLDASLTRDFIEESLKTAVQKIARDEEFMVDPALDRDTAKVGGSPDIAEAICRKIATADVFVADVSIINPQSSRSFISLFSRQRPTPNPNVLIELGFAVARLGWDRILLVQNTAFGSPEVLPFDVRGRRIVPYKLDQKSDRTRVETGLSEQLESALRLVMGDFVGPFPKPWRRQRWWGTWEIPDDSPGRDGKLFISEVGSSSFLFHLRVSSVGQVVEARGGAHLTTMDSAFAYLHRGDPKRVCELSFRRTPERDHEIIVNEGGGDCSEFRGLRVGLAGTFVRK